MKPVRILLVEDDALIRELLLEVLLEESFDVTEARCGDEAAGILQHAAAFDLLITDVHVPGQMNGVSLARYARSRCPDLAIIFATGRPETLAGFGKMTSRDACLAKPFSMSEVLRQVECSLLVTGMLDP